MAITKLGVVVVGVRGTIDGVTYSANKSGTYAKGWSRSTNPRTQPQATQRNVQSRWAAAWRNLTGAQKTAWDAYAAAAPQELFNSLGIGYFISGFTWYVKLNSQIETIGGTPITAAPTLAIPAAPLIVNMTFRSAGTAGPAYVDIDTADPNIGLPIVIMSQLVNSIGRIVGNPRKFLKFGIADAGTGLLQFKTDLATKYGTTVIGQKLFISCTYQNADGRRSPASVDSRDAI